MDDRWSKKTISILGVKEESRTTGLIFKIITQENLLGKKEKKRSLQSLPWKDLPDTWEH